MKIDLIHPFIENYKAAYMVINKEPRRVCVLVKKDNTKTSISYAKYLMSCSLGRILSADEQVDHIDNNKMNDQISNYQILTKAENIKKSAKGRKMSKLICPICNKEFIKPNNQISHKINPTCSRKCGGIKSNK